MSDDDEITATYVGAVPPPVDEVEWAMRNPLVGELMHDLTRELFPWQRRFLAVDPADREGPVFEFRAGPIDAFEAPDALTTAELDALRPVSGVRVGGRMGGHRPYQVWVDEMQEEPVRDERAEEARRIDAEQEAFDRHEKTRLMLSHMNRADRRRWLRENRPR